MHPSVSGMDVKALNCIDARALIMMAFLIETLRQQKVQGHGNLSQYFSDKFNNKEARD